MEVGNPWGMLPPLEMGCFVGGAVAAGDAGREAKAVKIATGGDGPFCGDYWVADKVVDGDVGAMKADPSAWLVEGIGVGAVDIESMTALLGTGGVGATAVMKASWR